MSNTEALYTPALIDINATAEVASGRSAAPIVQVKEEPGVTVIIADERNKPNSTDEAKRIMDALAATPEPQSDESENTYAVVLVRDDHAIVYWFLSSSHVSMKPEGRRITKMAEGEPKPMLIYALKLKAAGAQIVLAKCPDDADSIVSEWTCWTGTQDAQ